MEYEWFHFLEVSFMLLLNDDRQKISNETSKHLGAKNACILETLTGVTAEDSRRIETHYLVILATIIVMYNSLIKKSLQKTSALSDCYRES